MKARNNPFIFNRLEFGLRHLASDQRGMSTVEYVILLAVIVVGAVATWNSIGAKVIGELKESDTKLQTIGDGIPE